MRLVVRILLIVVTIALSSVPARAEESSHYFPGALSSFIDMLPLNTSLSTVGLSNDSIYYHGSNNHLNANATTYTNSSAFLYQFPGFIPILPGNAQYSIAFAVPYTWLMVHAPLMISRKKTILAKDTDNGFGDVAMFPFMLGWTKVGAECVGNEDAPHLNYVLKYQTQFGIYAPTGTFDNKNVANVGRNFWTFEPSAALSFFRYSSGKPRVALEFTTFAGFDFNTKNSATHYQSGDQFHLDGTLAVHVENKKGDRAFGAGVSGFFYQQITRDSLGGVSVPNFEAMTTGVGPELSFLTQIMDHVALAAEVKWLPELSVSNRLQGNAVWFKIAFAWLPSVPQPKCPKQAIAPFAAGAPYAAVAPYTSATPFAVVPQPSANALSALLSF
jgi:hypothetical protein